MSKLMFACTVYVWTSNERKKHADISYQNFFFYHTNHGTQIYFQISDEFLKNKRRENSVFGKFFLFLFFVTKHVQRQQYENTFSLALIVWKSQMKNKSRRKQRKNIIRTNAQIENDKRRKLSFTKLLVSVPHPHTTHTTKAKVFYIGLNSAKKRKSCFPF